MNNPRNSSSVIFPSPSVSSLVISFSTFSLLMLPPPSLLSSLESIEPELSLSIACRDNSFSNVCPSQLFADYFKSELGFIKGDFWFVDGGCNRLPSRRDPVCQVPDAPGLPGVVDKLLSFNVARLA